MVFLVIAIRTARIPIRTIVPAIPESPPTKESPSILIIVSKLIIVSEPQKRRPDKDCEYNYKPVEELDFTLAVNGIDDYSSTDDSKENQ